MKQKETLQAVSDATLEKPVEVIVDIHPRTKIQALGQKWGILPKKRVFQLRPTYLGTMIRISRILLSIEIKLPERAEMTQSSNLLDANYHAIADHSRSMAEIVALAIQNSKEEPSKALVDFVLNNFTSKEILGVLSIVLRQMDLTSFMSSIISVRGLNVLESQNHAPVKPVNGAEVSH